MKSCSNCGQPVEDTDLFCQSCGSRTPTQLAPGIAPPPQPGAHVQMPSFPPAFGEADRIALRKLYLGAIVMLIGLIATYTLEFGSIFFLMFSLFGESSVSSANPLQLLTSSGYLTFTMIGITIGGATEFVYLLQLRLGFKSLSGVDRSSFGTPSMLILFALIGVPFAIVGVAVEFFELVPLLASINPSQPTGQLPPGLVNVFKWEALSGIAGLAAAVGMIGGAILGVWRMGSRYKESLFKIGAIFFVIPFLDIVAPILLILGVNSATKKMPA